MKHMYTLVKLVGKYCVFMFLLTLGVYAQEGYGTCLVSVTTLASTSFVSTFQVRYIVRMAFVSLFDFNS